MEKERVIVIYTEPRPTEFIRNMREELISDKEVAYATNIREEYNYNSDAARDWLRSVNATKFLFI